MPTRKIADIQQFKRCQHPEHNPPDMICLPPGVYEHTCPQCGVIKVFVVPSAA